LARLEVDAVKYMERYMDITCQDEYVEEMRSCYKDWAHLLDEVQRKTEMT
jgi:hypothetical protein